MTQRNSDDMGMPPANVDFSKTAEYQPLLGEIKQAFVDGEVRKMVWNGEKWLFYADVYPLMYYAQTGNPLVVDKQILW